MLLCRWRAQVRAFRVAIEKTLEQQGAAKDGPNNADNLLHALRYGNTLTSPVYHVLVNVCVFAVVSCRLRVSLCCLNHLARSEMETMVSPPKKGIVPKIFGGVMKYIMWWIKTSAWLGGASEAKEYGTMPKTNN